MISYAPFWKTMETKGITQYKLIYHYQVSANTLQRIKRSQSINTNTLNLLCLILDCNVSDIIEFEKTEEEQEYLLQKDSEVEERKKSNASFRNLSRKNQAPGSNIILPRVFVFASKKPQTLNWVSRAIPFSANLCLLRQHTSES